MIHTLFPGDLVICNFVEDYRDCVFRVEKLYHCNDNVPFAFIRLVEGTCESRVTMTQRIAMQQKYIRRLPPLIQLARTVDEN